MVGVLGWGLRVTRMIFKDGLLGWGFELGIEGYKDDFQRWFIGLGIGGSAWLENRNGHH